MTDVSKSISGAGGCFRAGAQIQLQHGKTIAIETIKEGDEVLAFDDKGAIHVAKVTKVHYHEEPQPILKVKFWKGEIHITPNHWVLNQYDSFAEIGRLTEHDALVDGMGHLRPIIGAELVGYEPVWNLTVEPHHTFICDGVRVHNGGHRETHPAISGAGGGDKGGGRAAVEADDTLQSRAMVAILDLIGEGEIGGLVDAGRSIFLNDTALQNADNSYNFAGVTWDWRSGTQAQTPMAGFKGIEIPHEIENVRVKNGIPKVITISDPNVDQVRVIVSIPSLMSQNPENGDINGSSVTYQFAISKDGGPYISEQAVIISGKSRSAYQRHHLLTLPKPATSWNIQMSRLSADSIDGSVSNDTYFNTYTNLINSRLSYPNSALAGIRIDSSQFSQIPRRSYLVNGLYIKVPENYDPVTRLYTGTWNGQFKPAISSNPAWILYDLLTSNRYALGQFIKEGQVDKAMLYKIGRYCDELVDNGIGGTEPRFTINTAIQTSAEAYRLITDITTVFRGMAFWGGSMVCFTQDAPTDPSMSFTQSNVIDGTFNYSGSARKDRHSVVLVAWNDPAEGYKQKIEYVEDPELVAKYGVRKAETVAFGCTSRGQASRVGKWILYTERDESNLIQFKVGLDSALMSPGEVIRINDQYRAGARLGGRLISSTPTSATLDAPVTVPSANSTISIRMPSGVFVDRAILETSGTHSTVTWMSALTDTPVANAIWLLSDDVAASTLARVTSISQDSENKDVYIVSALEHNPLKYAAIEQGLVLEPSNSGSNPYLLSLPPTGLTAAAYLSAAGQGIDLLVSWVSAPGTRYATLTWRRDNDEIVTKTVYGSSYTIRGVSIGTYALSVSTTNSVSRASPIVTLSHVVDSVQILPDVTLLDLKQPFVDKFASFAWAPLATADSYTVQIVVDGVNGVGGVVKREVIVTDNWYVYDYAASLADGGGVPFRAFEIRVKARFGMLQSGNWAWKAVSNAAPAQPLPAITAITGGFQISAPLPNDTDYAGMLVWASTVSGFIPSGGNLVYDGVNNSANIIEASPGVGFTPGVRVYVRAAFYDVYGKTGLQITGEGIVDPLANVADIAVVPSLPASGYEGQVVYLTTDKKLYRWATDGIGGTIFGWRTWVDGSDILAKTVTAGEINVTELHSLSANMGVLTSGVINLEHTGHIQCGQSDYDTGVGFWMGRQSLDGVVKFSIGNPSGDHMTWDGSSLNIYGTVSVNYSNVIGKPTSLADINATEAGKLSGIATGATRNAYRGAWNGTDSYVYGDVATKDGSAWLCIVGTTGVAPPALPATSNANWAAYATHGNDGVNGTRTAILDMYRASIAAPTTYPSGFSTYTWSSGQFLAPATPNLWSTTPPTLGVDEKLWIIRQVYSDQSTSPTSEVQWLSNLPREAGGANGIDGINGARTAFLELYKWAPSTPTPTTDFPSGQSVYTWADGSFTLPVITNLWSLTPGAAVAGQTLWACSVRHTDQSADLQATVQWNTATAYAVGAAGSDGSNAKLAFLTASSQVFQVNKLAVATPSAITFTAYGQNVTDSPTFSIVPGSGTATLAGTGNTRTLAYADMSTDSVTVKVVWDLQEDYISVSKVREGADGNNGTNGLTVVVSNESHTLPATNAGSVTSYANSGTTIQVYEGAALLNAGGSAPGSFTIGVAIPSSGSGLTVSPATYAAQTATVPAHSTMLNSVDTATVTYPITVIRADGTVVSLNKVQTITKSKTGADGASSLTVVLSNDSHTLPAANDGAVTSYIGSGTAITVYDGTTPLLADAAASPANGSFKIGAITQNPAGAITTGVPGYAGNTVTLPDHSAMLNGTNVVTLTIPVTVKRVDGSVTTINKTQTISKSIAGATGASGSTVTITSDNPAVFTSQDNNLDGTAGSVNPPITFTANVTGIASPTYIWTLEGLQAPPVASTTATQIITGTQFGTSKFAKITCTVNGTYVDSVTIVRLENSTAVAGADKTAPALQSGVTITGGGITLGGTASIKLDTGGNIRGGQTAYDTGLGYFLGYSGGQYKFSIGDAGVNSITWDGATLTVTSDSIPYAVGNHFSSMHTTPANMDVGDAKYGYAGGDGYPHLTVSGSTFLLFDSITIANSIIGSKNVIWANCYMTIATAILDAGTGKAFFVIRNGTTGQILSRSPMAESLRSATYSSVTYPARTLFSLTCDDVSTAASTTYQIGVLFETSGASDVKASGTVASGTGLFQAFDRSIVVYAP